LDVFSVLEESEAPSPLPEVPTSTEEGVAAREDIPVV
jgi:hypothetical protein